MTETEPRIKVLFIGGLARSGTTLLERLLGQLPATVPLGEVAHIWERDVRADQACACGSAFSACEFWQRVGTAAFGGWEHVDLDRIAALRTTVDRTRHIPALTARKLKEPHRELVEEYASYYRRLYAAAAADSRAGVVIDSSKHPSLAYCLRRCPEIDLRVLHVVRDSRSVAHSWNTESARATADGEPEPRYSSTHGALLWNAQNAAFSLLRRRGVPVLRVRYEELLADPRGTVIDLADWMGAEVSDRDLRYIGDGYADLGPNHSAAGDPMRFTVGRVPLSYEDAWPQPLPAGRRRIVSTLTRPLLHRYGYRDTTAQPRPVVPEQRSQPQQTPAQPAVRVAAQRVPRDSSEAVTARVGDE